MFRLLLVVLFANAVLSQQYEDFVKVKQGLAEYIHTKTKPAYLLEATERFNLTHLFRHGYRSPIADNMICETCDIVAEAMIIERRNGAERKAFVELLTNLCDILKIESDRVCYGVLDLNVDSILYIVDNKPDLTAQRVCSSILQQYDCEKGKDYDWEINIPSGHTVDPPEPSKNAGIFNIIHISDFHYDPLYTAGKTSQCGDPVCCQVDSGDAKGENDACGYWSDYSNSDIPWHTVLETINHASSHHFDYVYYTGDIVSHRVWETSIKNNSEVISKIYRQLKESFNVPVFPVLGNHEPSPLNQWTENLTDPNLTTSWLFDLIAKEWSAWLPEDALETVLKGGFYTVSPRPGFRIVALNSNVCYIVNWWLIWDDFDPYGQLAWLAQVLLEAEKNEESVHIISHVPSGDDSCISVWSREFNKIIGRFANTVTGQFNGHTHKDEFQVFYNRSNPDQAINIAFNGASVVTFTDVNPSYKVIHVNNETFEVSNICEWTFNLTQANLEPEKTPDWYELYSFKKAYGLPSLKPSDVNDLLYRMAANQTLIKQFVNYRYRNSDPVNILDCDEPCQKEALCLVSVTQHGETGKCKELQKIWDDNNV